MELALFEQRVGQRLGIVPTAGSLAAEDAAVVRSAYGSLHAELLEHGLVTWNALEDVPDEFADVMIGMTAARIVDEFTIAEPRRSAILAQSAFGLPGLSLDERRLRKLVAVPMFNEPVDLTFF